MRNISFSKHGTTRIANPDGGPEKRGIEITKDIGILEPIMDFEPAIKTLHMFELNSSSDSCQNTCQNCFKQIPSGFKVPEKQQRESSLTKLRHEAHDKESRLDRCKNCEIYRYCTEKCRDVHWEDIHKYECPILSKFLMQNIVTNSEMLDFIRQAIRLYVMCKLDSNFKEEVFSLTSHSADIELALQFAWVHKYSSLITRIIDLEASPHMESYIFELLSILLVNSSVLMNEYQEAIGLSFDTCFSLINHSCLPNTFTLPLNNQRFCLVSTHAIKKSKEIYTNYCFTSIPKELRQKELYDRFFFACSCNLCKQVHDWFFSYNCPHCNMLFCSLTFSKFFLKEADQGYKFKGTKGTHICSNCNYKISSKKLSETRKMHQLLLALCLREMDESCLTTQMDGRMIGDLNQDLESYIIDANLETADIVETIGSYNFHNLTLSNRSVSFVKKICNKLRNDKIIPSYCFPLNAIYPALMRHEYTSEPPAGIEDRLDTEALLERLKVSLISVFEVYIPGDLTELKFSALTHLKELCQQLLHLSELLIRKNNASLDSWISNRRNCITTLLKCATFLNLQLLEVYLPLSRKTKSHEIVEESLKMGKQIKYIAGLKSVKYSIDKCQWYNISPKNFETSMFSLELKSLFDLGKIDFSYKKSVFKIQFADRNYKSIFKRVEELHSKNLEALQANEIQP